MSRYTDQIRKFISKNKEIIYIFLFTLVAFCMLSHFIPLTGDDWQNYGNGKMGFLNSLRNIKRYYLNLEGRIVSRTFIVFLTYGKIFWNILNALLFFGISYLIMKFNNIEEKVACFLLIALSILLINYNMFVECFLWVAGNLTYTLPTFLFLMYAYFILNFDKITNKRIIILSFLNLVICLFVENIAVAMIVFNILLNVYYYLKLKRINKLLISQIFISIIGLLIMMLSPGTLVRQGLYDEFNQLSLIGKIYHNLPNFAYYTYIIKTI